MGSPVSLGALMASFDATCVFFIFAILGGIAKVHGFAIWKYIRYIQEELLIVLDLVETHMPLAR